MKNRSCRKGDRKLFALYKLLLIAISLILIVRYIILNTSLYFLDKPDLPFTLHLNEEDIILVKGEEFKLFVYGINKRVSFSSTNFRVAGVRYNGKVKARNTGKAFIIVKVDDEEMKCRVRVIDINKDNLTLKEGEAYRLRVKGILGYVKWESSNSEAATVSFLGKVTAKQKGRTVITAEVKGRELKCVINVD